MHISKIHFKIYKRSEFYRRLVKIWERIAVIGITEDTGEWDRKRIRLLNGICVMGMLSLSIFCITYLDAAHKLTFFESFQGLVAYAFVMFLTSRHKFNAACHFFIIYNIISYSFQAISHGKVDGVEYILVASSVAGTLIFKDLWIIFLYFILNGLAFALCKYSFTTMKPFLFMANGENLYASNHILMFIILFLIVYYFKSENTRQEKLLKTKNIHLSEEKQKSDHLLLNILPYETAEELKETGVARSKSFSSVTVMFSDFRNFTYVAEKLSPEKLVSEIHCYFSMFDEIINKYNVEKIKTIGDAYMCAGGIPNENCTNAADVIWAAFEMQRFMLAKKREKEMEGELFFETRIGIHTGPVIAGIVGTKKFAYDIWGDTVNIARRMETCGEIGKVNISGSTFQLINQQFNCVYRGKVAAKNKGEIDMYFVDDPAKIELSD
ncbi:MAG TPA: adenylate/guanylate cyclase domain-containing protein [Mucilaginibacter sp.]|jgi:class 3 adenylate cyclase